MSARRSNLFAIYKKQPPKWKPGFFGTTNTPALTPLSDEKNVVEALLSSTRESLKEKDPERVSTNQIAKKAGVSIGSFYKYFWDKTGIFAAVIQQEVDRNVELFQQELQKVSGNDLRKKIEVLVQFSIRTLAANPTLLARLLRPTASGYFYSYLLEAREKCALVLYRTLLGEHPELNPYQLKERCVLVVNMVAQMIHLKIQLSRESQRMQISDSQIEDGLVLGIEAIFQNTSQLIKLED